jgi:CheY-like chemotaxis protein
MTHSARKGYDVLVARFEDVKIVFLDVVMPEVDGVECLQWIKENPEIAHIPVYMLSGLEVRMYCTYSLCIR